jgi:hypothetical protein
MKREEERKQLLKTGTRTLANSDTRRIYNKK